MGSVDDIVRVSISLGTTGIERAEFGVAMLVAPLMTFPERVRTYRNYAEAAEDDLPPSVLVAISDYFAQTPKPKTVKIGRRDVLKGVVNVDTLKNLTDYTITVNDEVYSYTSDASATAAEIVAGLAAVVLADTDEIITATVVGDTLELAWIGANIGSIVLGDNLGWGAISPLAGGTAVADDLTAIYDEDQAWYGLVMLERVKQTVLDAAAWTEANKRVHGFASNSADDYNVALDTDVFSLTKDSRYYRTFGIFTNNSSTEYPEVAWFGRLLTTQSGSETWALKQLASVTPATLTSTQANTIFGKGGNTFEYINSSVAITQKGKVAAGEWIDVIRFRDWLENTIQTNMATMMINRNKVPYTDQGIALCVNNLRKSLEEGQKVGGISPTEFDSQDNEVPGFIITAPLSVDVPTNIKSTRTLYLEFTARLAGAIHLVEITGSVGYSFE